jgi:hypothetical protein
MMTVRDEAAAATKENLSLFAFEMEVESKWNSGASESTIPERTRVATRGRENGIWSDSYSSKARFVDNDSPFGIAMTTEDLEVWLNQERKTRLDRRGGSIHDTSNRFLALHFPSNT